MDSFTQSQDILLTDVLNDLLKPENADFLAMNPPCCVDFPTPTKKVGKHSNRKSKKSSPAPEEEEEDVGGGTKHLLYQEGEIFDRKYHTSQTMLIFSSTSSAARSYGLLLKVEEKFPYARFSPGYSTTGTNFLTCKPEDRKNLGEAYIYTPCSGVDAVGMPTIVDLVTRVVPGQTVDRNQYTRRIVSDPTTCDAEFISQARNDTVIGRAKWWSEALNHLEKYFKVMNPDVKEMYIPAGVGSSVTNPFWAGDCIPLLEKFAKRMARKQVKVCVVTRGNHDAGTVNKPSYKRRGQWDDGGVSSKRSPPVCGY